METRSCRLAWGVVAALLAVGALGFFVTREGAAERRVQGSPPGIRGGAHDRAAEPERRLEALEPGERRPSESVDPPVAATEPRDDLVPAKEVPVVRVEGRVVDTEQAALEGAEVFARAFSGRGWDEGRLVARSLADGSFTGELASDRAWLVFTVFATGHAGASVRSDKRALGTLQLGTFVLAPGAEVTGLVVDQGDRGIEQAYVSAFPAEAFPSDPEEARRNGVDWNDDGLGFVVRAVTDSEGRFRLRGIPLGQHFLAGRASGKSWGLTDVFEVRADVPSEARIVLGTSPGASFQIRGVVLQPDGKPAARISVRCAGSLGATAITATAQSDERGRFVFDHAWTGPVRIDATDPESRWSSSSVEGIAPGTKDLELQLQEPVWLTVLLEDENGRAIPWGHVKGLDSGRGWQALVPASDTGRSGRAPIVKPALPFQLEASAPGYRTSPFGPYEPAALEDELVLTLLPGQAVRGHVLCEGRPVRGARVDLAPSAEPG